ncbi:MAG TPA: hypothetical protein PLY96_10745 [Chromatiaceae bacterium]|nr:hypothetical protein [Chromatiaceae bacterium]
MTLIVPDTLEFDLMLGEVPSTPYPLLPTIAERARVLLADRTPAQVDSAFYTLDWLLETAYHQRASPAPEPEEEQTAQPDATEAVTGQASASSMHATPTSPLRRRFSPAPATPEHDDLVFPPANPFTKLETLIDHYAIWEELIADDLPNPQSAEVYAVLALILVQDALTWLQRLRLSRHHPPTPLSLPIATAMALSGSSAIEAMAAINQAVIQNFSRKTREQIDQLIIERQAAKRASRAEHSALLNDQRHRKNREMKEKAISIWLADPYRWPSIPKAANAIADTLEAQGFKYEPSTIQNWLYEYANRTGKTLRYPSPA